MEQKTEASQAVDEPVLPHLPRAVGYRHTMDSTEGIKGNKPVVVFCATKPNPFGIPGLDYSASFPVTTETLFTADQMKAYARAALKAQPAHDHPELTTTTVDNHISPDLTIKDQPAHTVALGAAQHAIHNLKEYRAGRMPFPGEAIVILEAAMQPAPTEAAQGDRQVLQAEGKHPAPCARHCEATAFGIEIRRLTAENGQLRAAQGEDSARLVEMLDEIMQSVPRNMGRWDGGNAPGHCHTVVGIWDPDNGAKAGTKCAWCEIWQRADSEVKKHRARASAETGGVKP